ncbi:MAG: N-acetylneuraminate synthase [Maribacter sp.]|nr:N-acetylneuraminate synthase [Candidatus Brocadiaceae bacterium]MCP4978502.1 N-acetylneuraminate synthase [Maribacter sp.]
MKNISFSSSVYIVAEIGMNHDGSLGNALRLIESAVESGVDAVKFQMHISEAETTLNAPSPPYFTEETRYEYFNRTAFTDKQWSILINRSHELKIDFIMSPFSEEAVQRSKKLNVDCLKIASGEVNNVFLLNAVHASGVPSILSSGMSPFSELDDAVNILAKQGCLKAILQCSSKYPCPPEEVGLNVLGDLKNRYTDISIGLSDHTIRNYASYAAVTLGATVIEKHFTLTKKAYGPDAQFSLEPREMAGLVDGIRSIEKMRGLKIDKDNIMKYAEMRKVFCKSIVAKEKIKKGEKILYSMLTSKKPGYGLLPNELSIILNRSAKREIYKDEMVLQDDVE